MKGYPATDTLLRLVVTISLHGHWRSSGLTTTLVLSMYIFVIIADKAKVYPGRRGRRR